MNKRERLEAGGKVLVAMMERIKKADEVPALAAKEKARIRAEKYRTWNGRTQNE